MKINRKPDLMLLLALFVLIGVVFSTLSHNENSENPANHEQDATEQLRTQNKDLQEHYRGNYLRVSANIDRRSIP